MKEKRADPEALQDNLTSDEHGKLTVFLGTAAGVGKTYEMLETTQKRLAEGVAVERIMVCISSSPFSAQLIRSARRMAEGLKAEWLAVNVETPRRLPISEAEKDRLARNKHLAEELGAETISLTGNDVAEELLELARKRNVSQIVVGKPLHGKMFDLAMGSIVDRIIRHSQGIGIYVLSGKANKEQEKIIARPKRRPFPAYSYAGSLLFMLLVTVLVDLVPPYLTLVNIAMIYLLPVLFSAVWWGTGPAVIAAAASALIFDYYFAPPTYSFTGNLLISLSIFLLVALLTGTLSARLRHQITNARQRETRTAALYALSREIAAVADLRQVLESVARKVAESVEGQVVVLLPNKEGKLEQQACSGNQDGSFFNDSERVAATWAYEHGEVAGRGTSNLSAVNGLYLPLQTAQGTKGTLGIITNRFEKYLQPEQRRLLEAFAGLAAVAVARAQLAEQAREAHLLAESEHLRVALFDSLSHDLRTPLASIIGAVTGLLEHENVYSPAARYDLLQTIQQGATRMNRFVGNLLNMARLESSMLKLNKEWCDIQDVIGVSVSRIGEPLNNRPLKIEIQPDLPLVKADFVLLEQVMVNLLDNALKYSDAGSEISISARAANDNIVISVANRGPNIPPGDLERIFDKFYRLHSPRQVSGTGLGLAISKGFIEAHGGSIKASNNPAGGVVIMISLPLEVEGQVMQEKGDKNG
ncbi:MAG: Sensor protein KdpD [Pelotomaculum sp. PtaB.Bin013]|uniref:histidine kinase n=1 Tax=Pelotomaculum isophthalicicum JI TaxID=947010 RepID=A0A9X4JVQ6_9FIRM|nr:ATP-binding protein [Pelotomaculum isophthalicicum]MDF9408786.1 DUF4118 domain-containing protein [Pelotomaculum isophthalicicum JI]OPX91886.1 MAG: Sensor protein KdpD [Pelotomaculum sp. PtaB.Bin013]